MAATAIALSAIAVGASAPAPRPKTRDVKIRPQEMLIPAKRINALVKGMPATAVRDSLGAPETVKTLATTPAKTEVWTYRIAVVEHTEQVATSMRDVPAWDPLSNRAITVQEPVYQMLHTRIYTTLELLIVDGKLVERKGAREIEHSYT